MRLIIKHDVLAACYSIRLAVFIRGHFVLEDISWIFRMVRNEIGVCVTDSLGCGLLFC